MTVREFKDIRKSDGEEPLVGLPVDEFMDQLAGLQKQFMAERNRVWDRVEDGTLSLEFVHRLAKEYYWLGKFYTMEFGSLVANAPDNDALQAGTSEHFLHWAQNLSDEMGFAGDPNHVDMKVEWAHQMGISDQELLDYVPMPESVGCVFTALYYMRRSYEEGLASLGWSGERQAAGTGYAKKLYEGLRDKYGVEVENFRVHAYAEEDHGRMADYLLRRVAVTSDQQRRIRRAVQYTFLVRNARTVAMNRWLEEPGAIR